MYSQQDFNQEVFTSIKKKIGRQPTDEECKAVAHHMEYNIRADKNFANNGYLDIGRYELRKRIIWQIKQNLHSNDIPRYTAQYQKYKHLQRYCLLTQPEKNDIVNIATGQKTIDDYKNKEYLQKTYLKYFNQVLLPKIEQISLQKRNNLQYHGLWHTEQVAMLSIDIAIKEHQNPLPVLLAAALHDCARTSDTSDPSHGINCKPIAENFLQEYSDKDLLSAKQKEQIVEAVVFHNSSTRPQDNTILDCLQDADSMRLLWAHKQRFTPNTATGRDLARYSSSEQIKYLSLLLEKFRAAKPPQNFQGRSNNLSL